MKKRGIRRTKGEETSWICCVLTATTLEAVKRKWPLVQIFQKVCKKALQRYILKY